MQIYPVCLCTLVRTSSTIRPQDKPLQVILYRPWAPPMACFPYKYIGNIPGRSGMRR
jgi:hypothetical protein